MLLYFFSALLKHLLRFGTMPYPYYKNLANGIDAMIRTTLPLCALSFFGLDTWYATRILGWELDYDFGSKKYCHFHTSSNAVVRPEDYCLAVLLYRY